MIANLQLRTGGIAAGLVIASLLSSCANQPPVETGQKKIIHVEEITIPQIHLGIRSGNFSCEEIVKTYLGRIKKYDKPTGLNAITFVNPKSIERAIRLDEEWRREHRLRELHCVPIVVKDNFDTIDIPTTAGSNVLQQNFPTKDANMVRRLLDAGVIVLGKTNMGEWAFSPHITISSTNGTTRNPYDLERSPAGSSGGTAAAVAANLAAAGLGTDTGNSIRGPASHNALVGLRATIGVTSRSGIVPLLNNRDVAGPITRTVEDTARIFNIIAGYDINDPITKKSINKLPSDYTAYLRKDGLRHVRIGVLRAISNTDNADSEIKILFEEAILDLVKAGAVMTDPFSIAEFDKHTAANGFCSAFRWDINRYLALPSTRSSIKDFQEVIDKKLYHPSSQWAIDWVLAETVPPEQQNPPCLGVDEDPRRRNFLQAVLQAMDTTKIDAIIYPTWSNPPRKLDDLQSPHGNNSPIISPHTGQPSVSVPMGFTKTGLPAGLQFLGRPFADHLLLQYAYAYEQATQHRRKPTRFN